MSRLVHLPATARRGYDPAPWSPANLDFISVKVVSHFVYNHLTRMRDISGIGPEQ